ncbi:MAG: aspartate carbamoyltransferase, partial [Chloroflexota bacterium]
MDHVLSVGQFDRDDIDRILARSDEMYRIGALSNDHRLRGRVLATLFYEPSTRTRLSFESAMYRLGGEVISSEMAGETSSASKGESIEDTVRIVESYADAMVIRHPVAESVDRAAAVSSRPIVNAGDGAREHPTQALLDLYTIYRELGRIDNFTIALVGDLLYGRAPRSLASLLTLSRNVRIQLVSPPELEMALDVIRALDEAGVEYQIERDLDAVVGESDVVYMTRVQRERFPDPSSYDAVKRSYVFGTEQMAAMRESAVLMHPLPRVDEIDPAVDAD